MSLDPAEPGVHVIEATIHISHCGTDFRKVGAHFSSDFGQFCSDLIAKLPVFPIQISKRCDEQDTQSYNEHAYGSCDLCSKGPIVSGRYGHRLTPFITWVMVTIAETPAFHSSDSTLGVMGR